MRASNAYGSFSSPVQKVIGSPKVVRVAGQLLGAVRGDEEVVLDAKAAAAVPVRAGLDREHHAFLHRAAAGLVRVRRLVGPRADAVGDRMCRLLRKSSFGDAGADQPIELGETRAGTAVVDRTPVDGEQSIEQLVVARVERA